MKHEFMFVEWRGNWQIMRNTRLNRIVFSLWCYTFFGSEKDCVEESFNY